MTNKAEITEDILSWIPQGLGLATGLDRSVPAVRVWGIASFERAYSGNEARGTNEAFTDLEPFVRPAKDGQVELDARARIRATKFNYVRESYFRELIRRAAEPYLKEVAEGSASNEYSQLAENTFEAILDSLVPSEKKNRYRLFFKALLVKTAACSPATPCGACPACIAEGSAATTQAVGVSLPHNWEKKFKETDFKTFRTARSSAEDLLINVDGQILEPALTEVLVRNRMPRAGDNDTATAVDNTAQSGKVVVGGQMILREHMFKGAGYIKTTVFNPTKLELAMLAYEHLIEDVRRGAKTSSGAGVWSWRRNPGNQQPLLVVDEVISSRGFPIHAPVAGVPVAVMSEEQGVKCCFADPLSHSEHTRSVSRPQVQPPAGADPAHPKVADGQDQPVAPSGPIRYAASGQRIDAGKDDRAVLIRYVGDAAMSRLQEYLQGLDVLEDKGTPQDRFTSLAQHAAAIIARLIKPRKAIENILAEFAQTVDHAAPPTEAGDGKNSGQAKNRRRGRK
jgi:hypothetical protein